MRRFRTYVLQLMLQHESELAEQVARLERDLERLHLAIASDQAERAHPLL